MSLAWGSKFLEYSATAQIVDTSPAVFRCLRRADEACRVQLFAHSQASLRYSRDLPGCEPNSKTVCQTRERSLGVRGAFMNYVRQQQKRSQNPVLFVAALILLSLASATLARAQQCTDSWTGAGGDNNWSNGANWSNGSEPGNTDTVCIQTSGAAVLLDVAGGVADLAVGSSDSLTFPTPSNTNNGLSISGSSITNSGQIIMAAPVSFGSTGLNLSSSGTVILSGRGTITLQANSFGGDSIGGSAILLNRSTIQG